ncbi:unnamed protein product [Arabidopsis halleri]
MSKSIIELMFTTILKSPIHLKLLIRKQIKQLGSQSMAARFSYLVRAL